TRGGTLARGASLAPNALSTRGASNALNALSTRGASNALNARTRDAALARDATHAPNALSTRGATDALSTRGATDGAPPAEAPGEGGPGGLAVLAHARACEGMGRASTLAMWSERLRQIPASPGARAARAEALLGALSSQDLGALDGFRGTTARSLAVEALL